MSKIVWDAVGERHYETGISKGVLFPFNEGEYQAGVAWNGLITVTESPTGAEPNAHWADNIKYLNLLSAEEFEATIEAYTYPDEFAICDGSAQVAKGVMIGQQTRKMFGLAYTTQVGNDTDSEAGYKIHLVWGALASPSDKSYQTINDSPEAITFSWSLTTTPAPIKGHKPTATMVIDSRHVDKAALLSLEEALYSGVTGMPTPDEVVEMLNKEI